MLELLSVATQPRAATPMPLWGRGVMLLVLFLLILLLGWGVRSALRGGTLASSRGRYGRARPGPPTTRADNPLSFWCYIGCLLFFIVLLLGLAALVVLGALQQ